MKPRLFVLSAFLAGAALSAPAMASEALAQKAGCLVCHNRSGNPKTLGPAYKDVAAKYKGQDVAGKLMEKVRKGGGGVWGPVPMPPNGADKINDADLKTVVEWVLNG